MILYDVPESKQQEENWLLALITDVNIQTGSSPVTYNLTVIDPGKHNVNPDAVHVVEKLIRKRVYIEGELVETRIIYGTRDKHRWVPAKIVCKHDEGTYDLIVQNAKELRVSEKAVFVAPSFLRPILKLLHTRKSLQPAMQQG